MTTVATVAQRRTPSAPVAGRRREVSARRIPLWAVIGPGLLVIEGRGAFEVAAGKTVGYALGALAAIVIIAVVFARSRPTASTRQFELIIALLLLAATGVVSTVSTLAHWSGLGWTAPLFFLAVWLLVCLLLAAGAGFRWPSILSPQLSTTFLVVAVVQVGVGLAQQYGGLTVLPGSDSATFGGAVRPAGITGSYLHYPLVLAISAIIAGGMWLAERRRRDLLTLVLCVGAVGASLSRSGMMILGLWLLICILTRTPPRIRFGALCATVVGAAAVVGLGGSNELTARILSSVDTGSSGNSGRLQIWIDSLDRWLTGPILIGQDTGLVTNVTRNFGRASLGVAESSLVEALLNLGLIGAACTYYVLIAAARAAGTHSAVVGAGALACVVQTLIYQSVEVLPFASLLAFLPLIFGNDGVEHPSSDRARAVTAGTGWSTR